jgi:ComF family protein
MKQFLTLAKNLIFPTRCAGCHALLSPTSVGESAVFCTECAKEWHTELCLQCPVCFAAYPDCRCQSSLMKKAGSTGLLKLVPYGDTPRERVARRIVLDMKRNPRRRTLQMLASELAVALNGEIEKLGLERENTVLVHLPRDPRSVRKHGADQAALLASALAAQTGLAHLPLLYRAKRVKQQKRLTATERAENLRDAFAAREIPAGCSVILVDDVVTTGSGMAEGVRILRESGAGDVICVSIGRSPEKKQENVKK